jgi:hypothetical protein
MPDVSKGARERLIEFYLDDASERLRFQQEFSAAGFKALILINGGAVIALLTYAGNADDRMAGSLQWAFAGYILGLVFAVLAYLTAYAGQALIMRHSVAEALAELRVQERDAIAQNIRERRANISIGLGVGLCVFSLAAFIGGSLAAMAGLTLYS